MANLSNINGKFVVEQTTGYVGVGTTDPNYPIEVLNASAEIALNASGGSIYRLRSDSASNFIIRKEGVGDRLVINSAGNATFAGNVTTANLFLGSSSVRISPGGNGEIGLNYNTGATGSLVWYAGGTASKFSVTNTGNATFAGTVTATTFLGDLNGTINTATTGTTQTAGNNSTLIATTAYADAAAAAYLLVITYR